MIGYDGGILVFGSFIEEKLKLETFTFTFIYKSILESSKGNSEKLHCTGAVGRKKS
jgi:hypothetical protein